MSTPILMVGDVRTRFGEPYRIKEVSPDGLLVTVEYPRGSGKYCTWDASLVGDDQLVGVLTPDESGPSNAPAKHFESLIETANANRQLPLVFEGEVRGWCIDSDPECTYEGEGLHAILIFSGAARSRMNGRRFRVRIEELTHA